MEDRILKKLVIVSYAFIFLKTIMDTIVVRIAFLVNHLFCKYILSFRFFFFSDLYEVSKETASFPSILKKDFVYFTNLSCGFKNNESYFYLK